jgi:hypothetical protein
MSGDDAVSTFDDANRVLDELAAMRTSAPAEPTLRERLESLRDRLLGEIENDHDAMCGCVCGKSADSRTLAALSKEYRAVLVDIEQLPADEETSASARLRQRVADQRPGGGSAT